MTLEKNEKKELIKTGITTIAICLIVFSFIRPAIVNQVSMVPTFQDGDRIVYAPFVKPERNDIIVFNADVGEKYIKRVIGMPGDTVEVMNGKVFINGKEQDQSYTNDQTTDGEDKYTVKEDEYYVMGDNRLNSIDSREFGPVKKKDVLGTVVFKFFPPEFL